MAKASEITDEVVVCYAKHEFDPVETLDFIQFPSFSRKWKRCALTDQDMRMLRILISMAPQGPPVIKGSGGIRKIRFAPPKSNSGKRSGYRVCYLFSSPHGIVLLMRIYAKNEQDNLTHRQLVELRQQAEEFERQLGKGPIH